ncbi:NAD-dependent histone deacetylase sir2 [Coemansia sp. RSA 2618]|nr:NAD-dependent histone deacetylase sir2 [Coemansia sp. RSA 2618]
MAQNNRVDSSDDPPNDVNAVQQQPGLGSSSALPAAASGSTTSLSSVKRRGTSGAEGNVFITDTHGAAQGAKRHRREPISGAEQLAAALAEAGSDSSDDEDYNAEAGGSSSEDEDQRDGEEGHKSDDEDLNIDGSYAPSPLDGMSPAPYTRFTHEEMEAVRAEAYALGLSAFLQEYIARRGVSVRALLEVFAAPVLLDSSVQDLQLLPLLRHQLVRFYRNRPRLANISTIDHVVDLLKRAKRILVLTGAGVSVSCGIPDFRSPAGIYTRLNEEFGLDDPQQMFDIEYFRETPELFYSFAKELYPYNFTPAPSHAFVKLLEDQGKLLRNYTQNIDTLEHVQGITNVLNCHGSFATATCIKCGFKCDGKELEPDIMSKQIAYCPKCNDRPQAPKHEDSRTVAEMLLGDVPTGGSNSDSDDSDDEYGVVRGIMKPDITFFGEKLPDQFDEALLADREQADLLLVMGSSLKVAPVSDIMGHLPHAVPQIVINKTPILHFNFDVQLLGNADDIVAYLARRCGWVLQHERIPGESTESAAFEAAALAPVDCPQPPVTVMVRDPSAEDGATVEKPLEVPAHWHVFPSAVVTPKDLLVANGATSVRLAVDSSDEDDGSDMSDDSDGNDDGKLDAGTNGEAEDAGGSDTSDRLAQDISKATV